MSDLATSPGATPTPSSDDDLLSLLGAEFEQEPGLDVVEFRKTDQGKSLSRWAREKFDNCSNLREKEEKQWNLNLAMYSGNQWAQKMPKTISGWSADLMTPPAPKGKERRTINRVKAICRTEMAKFLSKKPGATIIPATSEQEDYLMAQAGQQVWEALSERCGLASEFVNAIFWMVITGNGFIKTYWDDAKYDKDAKMEGDIEYGAVDPYKLFFPDLKIHGIQRQPYLFHAYTQPTEKLLMTYAHELEGMNLQPSRKEEVTILEAAFANPKGTDEKEYDSNMVRELWVKPGSCPHLPEGGRIIFIEDIMVAADIEGLPYEHGEYPFSHLGHILTGRFYYSSIIEDIEDLQKDYNKMRSQIAEAIYKMSKPQLSAMKGSISAARMTNETGLVVEYKAGHQPPTPIPIQPLPSHLFDEIQLILTDFEDISGQHQVTKGTVPPGVTAAAAISYLQEADDSYLFTSYQNVERAYESLASQTLQLAVQFWDVPRLVKITGTDQEFSTIELSGADLRDATDVRVEKGSALPQSRAARQALLMDLMTNGFMAPDEGLQLLEIGGAQSLMDRIKNDRKQASRENVQFKMLTTEDFMAFENAWQTKLQQVAQTSPEMLGRDGELMDPQTGMPVQKPIPIPANDFDNHAVHIEEHNRFRKSEAYGALSPETKELIEQHVQQHKQMMANEAVQNMLAQIPTDGSVPGVDGTMPEGTDTPTGGTEMTPEALMGGMMGEEGGGESAPPPGASTGEV